MVTADARDFTRIPGLTVEIRSEAGDLRDDV
jgi:hypothetical protein